MITVDRYISDLLYLHDCVIVPGLGGFVANYRPAEVRESQHLFIPPVKEIGFNRSLLHNDGLLATCIARRELITYVQAVSAIERFVSDVYSRISAGKTVDLGETGSLRKDAMGNILFSPKEGSSFLPGSMGLDSFRFIPLEQKHSPRIEFHDDYILNPAKRKPARYWVAAASLAALFTLFSVELKMPSISQAGVGETFFARPHYTELIETAPENSDVILNEVEASAAEENSIIPSKNSYHLIAGSFRHTNPASRALSEYRKSGFSDAALLTGSNGRIRISLCAYPDKDDAIEKLNQLRQQPHFSAVWVLTEQ